MLRKALGLLVIAGAIAAAMGSGCSSSAQDPADAAAPVPTVAPDAGAPDTGSRPESPLPPVSCQQDITGKATEVKATLDDEAKRLGPYKSTPPSTGQCTAATIAEFAAYLKAQPPIVTYDEMRTKLATIDANCAACTFKARTDATWGPYMTAGSPSGGTTAVLNVAGCYEAVGVSQACAKAIHYYLQCALVVCARCEGTQLDMCRDFIDDSRSSCSMELYAEVTAACKGDPKLVAASVICEPDRQSSLVTVMTGACGPVSADAGGGG